MAYTPGRGDIIWTDFDPSAGHEQAHKRPALVLSPVSFNRQFRLALVAPITSRIRGHGFEVQLDGGKTSGVVLCHQTKTIDFVSRGCKQIETASPETLRDVLAKVAVLIALD